MVYELRLYKYKHKHFINLTNKVVVVYQTLKTFGIYYRFMFKLLQYYFMVFNEVFYMFHKLYELLLLGLYEVFHKPMLKGVVK